MRSLERLKRIMGRWMCGVSLKDRKRSVNFNSFLGVHADSLQSVADVVKRSRSIISIWFDRLNIWDVRLWMIGG